MSSSLPLPKSGRIRYICHIADIHIRPGTESKESRFSRFDEFLEVFNSIAAHLESRFKDSADLVIVIAGDIVHDNRKAGAPCIELFYEIMSRLSRIAPIYIIRGNHDYNQSSFIPQDILGSLMFGLKGVNNIAYLSETGIYDAANIVFGVLAIQDALKAGDTHGRVEDLPAFPRPYGNETKTKVALFHGDVPHTYPLEWISSDYDIVMMGDLHGQQVENMEENKNENEGKDEGKEKEKESKVNSIVHIKRFTSQTRQAESPYPSKSSNPSKPWAYPGSTIQQNFGEALFGHGFLLWDIDEQTVDTYHVCNRFGFVSVMFDPKSESVLVDLSTTHKQCLQHNWVKLDDAVQLSWFPKIVRLRIKKDRDYEYAFTRRILEAFQKRMIQIESSQENFINQNQKKEQEKEINDTSEDNIIDRSQGREINLQKYNNPQAWCQFVKDSMTSRDEQNEQNEKNDELLHRNEMWQSWFLSPETLTLDLKSISLGSNHGHEVVPPSLQNDINERNRKILLSVDDYHKTIESLGVQSDTLGHTSFSLLYMNWSYILCFKDKCHFNFETLENNVYCVGGKNGFGKTSFLETICISLFGEGFPNRTTKQYSSSIICMQIPPKKRAYTSIVFRVDHETFRLKRTFEKTSTDAFKLQSKEISLEKLVDGEGGFKEFHSGKKATQEWMMTHVGSIESFLTSVMVSQNCEEEFFAKKGVEQKAYLDKQLKLESSTAFMALLKTATLGYVDILKRMRDVIDMVTGNEIMKFDVPQYEKNESKLRDLNDHMTELLYQRKLKREYLDQIGADESLMPLGHAHLHEKIVTLDSIIHETANELNAMNADNLDDPLTATEREVVVQRCDALTKETFILEDRLKSFEESTLFLGIDETSLTSIKIDLQRHDDLKPCLPTPGFSSVEYLTRQLAELEALFRGSGETDEDQEYSTLEAIRTIERDISEKEASIDSRLSENQAKQNEIIIKKKAQKQISDEIDGLKDELSLMKANLSIQNQNDTDLDILRQKSADMENMEKKRYYFVEKYDSKDEGAHIQEKHAKSIPSTPRPTLSIREIKEKESRLSNWIGRKAKIEAICGAKEEHLNRRAHIQEQIVSTRNELASLSEQMNIHRQNISRVQNEMEIMVNPENRPAPSKHRNEREREIELEGYYKKKSEWQSIKNACKTEFEYCKMGLEYFESNTNKNNDRVLKEEIKEIDTLHCVRCIEMLDRFVSCLNEFKTRWDSHVHKKQFTLDLQKNCGSHEYNLNCLACQTHPLKRKRDLIQDQLDSIFRNEEELLKDWRDLIGADGIALGIIMNSRCECDRDLGSAPIADCERIIDRAIQYLNSFRTYEKHLQKKDKLRDQVQELRTFWKSEFKIVEDNQRWAASFERKKNELEEAKKSVSIIQTKIEKLEGIRKTLLADCEANNDIDFSWRALENEWKEGIEQVADDLIINNSETFEEWDSWMNRKDEIDRDLLEWNDIDSRLDEYRHRIDGMRGFEHKSAMLGEKQVENARLYDDINSIENAISEISNDISNERMSIQALRSIDLPKMLERHKECIDLKERMSKIREDLARREAYDRWEIKRDELSNRLKWKELHDSYSSRALLLNKWREFGFLLQERDKYLLALRHLKDWIGWTELNKSVEDTQRLTCQSEMNVSFQKEQYQNYLKHVADLSSLNSMHKHLTGQHTLLLEIMDHFSRFKDWVLEHKIIPIILDNVNSLLDIMCVNHRPIMLDCVFERIKKEEVQRSFTWVFHDGNHRPPLEKASGFQKCVINLSMRIVLGRLGVSGIKNTQLFIDEGFTSCDEENLQNIPYVLKRLLSMYSSVILVSHLDELKNHVPSLINIERDDDSGLSCLQFGDKSSTFSSEKR